MITPPLIDVSKKRLMFSLEIQAAMSDQPQAEPDSLNVSSRRKREEWCERNRAFTQQAAADLLEPINGQEYARTITGVEAAGRLPQIFDPSQLAGPIEKFWPAISEQFSENAEAIAKGQGGPEDRKELANAAVWLADSFAHQIDLLGAKICAQAEKIQRLEKAVESDMLDCPQEEIDVIRDQRPKMPLDMTSAEWIAINSLAQKCHEISASKGWWDNDRNVPEMLALIHSEISEALECYRNDDMASREDPETGKPEGFGVELIDALIRILDVLFVKADLSVAGLLNAKMRYNQTRSHRHGGKQC